MQTPCHFSPACALPKSNGDIRPIATSIGESLKRITAKTLCLQKRSDSDMYFSVLYSTKCQFLQEGLSY